MDLIINIKFQIGINEALASQLRDTDLMRISFSFRAQSRALSAIDFSLTSH